MERKTEKYNFIIMPNKILRKYLNTFTNYILDQNMEVKLNGNK